MLNIAKNLIFRCAQFKLDWLEQSDEIGCNIFPARMTSVELCYQIVWDFGQIWQYWPHVCNKNEQIWPKSMKIWHIINTFDQFQSDLMILAACLQPKAVKTSHISLNFHHFRSDLRILAAFLQKIFDWNRSKFSYIILTFDWLRAYFCSLFTCVAEIGQISEFKKIK